MTVDVLYGDRNASLSCLLWLLLQSLFGCERIALVYPELLIFDGLVCLSEVRFTSQKGTSTIFEW